MIFLFQKIKRSWLNSHWLSVLLGLNFSVVAFCLARQVQMREQNYLEQLIQSDSQAIEVAFTNRLKNKISSLKRMGNRWMLWSEEADNLWQTDTYSYLESYPHILALGRINPDSRVQWVIPTIETQNISRLHEQIKRSQPRVITQSQVLGETQISDLVELNYFNQELNKGLIVYVPLVKDKEFQGWLLAIIDVDSLFNLMLQELAKIHDYQINLTEKQDEIYQTNSSPASGRISSQQVAYSQIIPVKIAGASWELKIIPSSKILSEHYSYLPIVIFSGGLFISGLLGLMVYLLQGRTRQLNNIKQLNCSLLTLSECNQALVRATTEQELLKEICQILVKIGGFQRVRVGLVQPDSEKLCWVADSNIEELSNVDCCQTLLNVTDKSTAISLQTGIYNITFCDLCTEDSTHSKPYYRGHFPLLWKSEHNRIGSIGREDYSLLIHPDVFGVLVLESPEKKAFDEAEILLLQELTADIAYGINSLRTRQARRESEEKFRQIAENLGDVFFVHSLYPPQLLYVNPAYEKIWGKSCQEYYQRHDAWLDAVHPDDRQQVLEKLNFFMKSGEVALEYRIIRETGEVRWISSKAFPLYNQQGEVYRSVGIATDTTHRKQAEEQLSKLSERWQLALKSGEIAIWEWDVVNNILTWDERMYELYGVESSDFGGVYEAWKQGVHPDDQEGAELAVKQALRGEKEYNIEFRVLHPDGSIRHIKADAIVQCNQTGKALRMTGINYDITSRKQAEIRLKEQKELLETILDNIPVMLVLMDSQNNFLWVNQEWEENSGYKFEEISQFDIWADAFPDLEYCQDLRKKLQAEPGNWVNMKIRVRDGRITEQTWMNIFLSDGNILAIGQDITERKRDEEKLRESEERLRQVLENMTVMLDAFDERGNIIAWNKACEKITGYTAAEMIGNPDAMKLLYPDVNYRQQMMEAWQAKGNYYYDWEWNLIAKDGRVKSISWTNISDVYPVPGWATWGIGIDVTERKRNEEKERLLYQINQAITAAEDLDSALEIALSFICESINWDFAEAWIPDEKIQSLELCSHFYSKSSDFEPFFFGSLQMKFGFNEGLPGRVWASQKPQWLTPLSKSVDSVYLRKELAELVQLKTALAIPILLESQIVAIFVFYCRECRYRDQNLIELICSLGDQLALTVQRRRIEQEVRELNQSLEERVKIRTAALEATNQALQEAIATADAANSAKSTFLAQMSHELRTPLNGILGYTQILQRDRTLTDQQQQSLEVIYKCGEHLLDLINDILDLAKIEAKKMELHPTAVRIETFLDEIAAIFHPKAESKGLNWIYISDEKLSNLYCLFDKKRLRQVLLNLLSNAIKFTDRGEVMFAVEAISPFPNSTSSVTVRFKVEDTGIGIPSESLERLFRPFEQGTEAYKQSEGTGLGLTITQKLLEMMDTQLKVESEYNQGSLFRFDLQLPIVPAVAQTGDSSKVSKTIIGIVGKSPQVLVVDDRLENCLFLQEFLSSIGFRVEIAKNGKIALEKMELLHPDLDLMIVDLIMPEMGGVEMIAMIRQNPAYENLKVIVASASGFLSDKAFCFEAGCDAFLIKPIESNALLNKLDELLNIKWIYAEENDSNSALKAPINGGDELPVNIDDLLLENLYELALDGKIKQIKQQALNLKQIDASYAPFAEALLELANQFKEKEICQIIERYRSKNHE
ncbi:MAG: PAS domain S-box protein [Lyngbya sp.]|nr:PAS domain S-box protein [Lyngbya sp.]